ncbi:leukotriene B4 receptor 1-like [Microcaecilia unicolor]|uniref:Leukotriene B4 receptor 1-like n=1 Tax=Microcaecilia unicolor TaxID=1415580 RepID=A0A6P7Y7B6_9AMPH|nr:leukotriene B4 receptor 1-like [Microcaecilia unicolor]
MDPSLATVKYEQRNDTRTDSLWVERTLAPCLFFGACFLVGIPGNCLVIWTILTKIPHHSFTVMLLLNLAIADIITLGTLPFSIHNLVGGWIYGLHFCKFLTYLICSTMYASVYFITLLSVHRFIAVLFPFQLQRLQRKNMVPRLVVAVWILALGLALPAFLFRSTVNRNGTVQCTEWEYTSDQQQVTVLLVETLVGFAMPFTILIICYICVIKGIKRLKSPRKNKSGKLIVSVVFAFFVCWSPHYTFKLLIVSSVSLKSAYPETSRALARTIERGRIILIALLFLSSCLNPLLYAFAARIFHRGLSTMHFVKLFGQLHEDIEQRRSLKPPSVLGGCISPQNV